MHKKYSFSYDSNNVTAMMDLLFFETLSRILYEFAAQFGTLSDAYLKHCLIPNLILNFEANGR